MCVCVCVSVCVCVCVCQPALLWKKLSFVARFYCLVCFSNICCGCWQIVKTVVVLTQSKILCEITDFEGLGVRLCFAFRPAFLEPFIEFRFQVFRGLESS